MNKEEFLKELRKKLSGLSKSDIEERVSFYGEMIDDRMEEGLSEQEAVEGIGTVDSVVEQIMSEIPLSRLVKEKVRGDKKPNILMIVLLVIGFPVWFPLAVAVLSVIFSLYVTVWSIVISFFATDLALAAASCCCLFGSVVFLASSNPAAAVFSFGGSAICAGLAILFFILSLWISKGIIKLTGKMFLGIKTSFIGKEAKENEQN